MRIKTFSDDFKKLIYLEYPDIPEATRNQIEHGEAKSTRHLDNQCDLASVAVLHSLGKDVAWSLIERSIYRREIFRVANAIIHPSEKNIRYENDFVKKNKWRLENGNNSND